MISAVDDLAIRREELLNVLRLGTVRWWKEDKGFGRITADDGEVLFASFAYLVKEGYKTLTEGQRVSFVWRGSYAAEGRHAAEEVRVIGDAQPPEADPGPPESGAGNW
jgi:CspA family cold shock protein